MKEKKSRARLVLAIIFLLITLACMGAEGYLYYLCTTDRMPYMRGFLTAIPIVIVMYWFSCFFDDITYKKGDEGGRYIINKHLRRMINTVLTLVCIASVALWLYLYHTQIQKLF